MCGLTGFLNPSPQTAPDIMQETVKQMTDTLVHRGPDDSGAWVDAEAGVALGHRRLSILDLSPEGRQPMISAGGRYVITFNGEIYNFSSLRRELAGMSGGLTPAFRGHSDTEIMLAAIAAWGPEKAVKRFTGMFAFALWDREARLLYLGRDRLGEKPLYYGWIDGIFMFASELKALCAHPRFRAEIDRDALTLFLRHKYIPAPYSIYKGIYKLPPGTMLTVHASQNPAPEPVPYWSAQAAAETGLAEPFRGSEAEAFQQLDNLLREVISRQMVADVPVGAFLSGGIDSSTVVALMQTQSRQPVRTFTIGFHEAGYNEAEHAKEVAAHLGTHHTELYVTPQQAMDVIPKLPGLYDEPFADASQIPTLLLSGLTRQHVTVSLSGDGGDELFGGYNHYSMGRLLWSKLRWLPQPGRRAAARLLLSIPAAIWDTRFGWLSALFARSGRVGPVGDKIYKLAEIISIDSPRMLYRNLVSNWQNPADLVPGAKEPVTALTDIDRGKNISDFTSLMMFLDTVSYLPDDILVKVDRASMGVSLESRIPLLDHQVVEFAWRLPLAMKIRGSQGKWLLRQVLYQYVPKELIERPKMGFGVPIDLWLRGPLRAWAEELLAETRLRAEGFLNPVPIREKWAEHLTGKRNWQYYLWNVLMFQAWLNETKH